MSLSTLRAVDTLQYFYKRGKTPGILRNSKACPKETELRIDLTRRLH